MVRQFISLLAIATLCSCGWGKKKSDAAEFADSLAEVRLAQAQAEAAGPVRLDSLTVGEFAMRDDAFGETIELTGTPVEVDDIFKVSGTEAFCIDTLLVMSNRQRADGRFLSVYSLPSLRFITSLGTLGRGPGEFNAPTLVRAEDDPNALCYVIDHFSGQLSALTPQLTLEPVENPLPAEYRKYTSEKMYTACNTDEMIFGHASGLMRWRRNDSLSADNTSRLFNLSLRRVAPGVSYIGAPGVNYKQERFAYAYKFVKRIVFGDFGGRVRALQWGKAEGDLEDDASNRTGSTAPIDQNVTHYWKIYTTPKHVYVTYSGRTPVEVHGANQRGDRHIFVEKFDWNGNPVKRYRLDEWGYFTVDEERETLYLLCTENPVSFRVYKL